MIWTVLFVLAQIAVGLLYGNMVEWLAHKYLLHHLGRKKTSWFAFHWHEHHRKSRQNNFQDDDYEQSIWNWNARGKEALGLFLLWATHIWTAFFFPVFFLTVTYCTINYYYTHKWSHENPEWAKKNLRWHWEHHMGRNQHANYCVTQPWFDYIAGTRVHYREKVTSTGRTKLEEVRVKHPLRRAA